MEERVLHLFHRIDAFDVDLDGTLRDQAPDLLIELVPFGGRGGLEPVREPEASHRDVAKDDVGGMHHAICGGKQAVYDDRPGACETAAEPCGCIAGDGVE